MQHSSQHTDLQNSVRTDGLKGKLTSLDDSSPKNLERLVKLSRDLLDESVAVRNFDTGELEPISSGEMNRDALHRFAEWLSEEHKARQFHAIKSSSSSSSVSKTKVFKPMLPNPSSLPSKLDPEVGGEEKIMTSAEDLEKSKDKANGGGGGCVRPSIFEHGHDEESSSFVSSPYIPSSAWSFFDNPFELPQPDISFTDPPGSSSDPPKHSADSPGYSDPPKYSVDSPGYYFDPPKCSINSPGYPDLPHPLSYYCYIGFPEPLYASSLHPNNDEMHPGSEASSYKRNYCESSDRLLSLLPTPITPKFYSYGNSRFSQEHEDYPQSQFSNSASTKIDDYFQLFS
ncbi:hypothetical protein CY35_02G176000 [Sphagnum magellanicum]|nr:hypothetical protein CY35_02G176000 [Sphagnum magellanicum]